MQHMHIGIHMKRRKDYTFWRQFNEKPSIILGCPCEATIDLKECTQADADQLVVWPALQVWKRRHDRQHTGTANMQHQDLTVMMKGTPRETG